MNRSAELPNLVLTAIGAGTWDMDIASATIRHNSVLAALGGFTDGKLERPLNDFLPRMHPEEIPLVMQRLKDAAESGKPYSSIHRILRPDGTFSWLQDLGRVVEYDPEGRATRMVGAARDVTEEVNTRMRLQEAETFFGDLVESVPGAIMRITVTRDGAFQLSYISPRCEEIWEISAQDVLASNDRLRDMMDAEDSQRMRDAFASSGQQDALLDLKGHIVTPSGKHKDLHIFGRPSSRRGDSVVWTVLALDITEEVTTRNKLRETEGFFADLVERLPGAILRIAVQDDGQMKHEYISPRCLEIWEVPAEELLANKDRMRDMMEEDSAKALRVAFQTALSARTQLDLKVFINTPSGRRKQLHIVGAPSARAMSPTVWTMLAVDFTEQARLEEELLHSREIILQAQKVEAIGNLTGGMAHDFNNLLAVILGNLELIQDNPQRHRAEGFIQDAIDAALRGGELTRSLLSFARKAPLAPVTLNLNDVVRGLDSILRRTLPENIELECVATGGLWKVRADRSSTENAILNLVINARDAMPAGGKITIETANVRLTDEYIEDRQEQIPPGRYVMLAVTDTGTGISPENLSRIFEPFFTTKPVGKGTGLGLSSLLGFARQSGGTVQVYSEVGVGTTFKIYFRASNVPDTDGQSHEGQTDLVSLRGKVLLVEDDHAVRKVMRSRLQIEGCKVFEADQAETAIAQFEAEGPFDLILTDIVMPGNMPGTALVRELRKRDPGLKAIFMSGYPNEAAIHGNGLREEDIKLMKPVTRENLFKALAKALASGPKFGGQR